MVAHMNPTDTAIEQAGAELAPLLLPITPAANHIAVGRSTLYELIAAGEIESVHIGRRHLVVRSSLDAYVERLRDAS